MTTYKSIFQYQIWHALLLATLIFMLTFYLSDHPDLLNGEYLSISTSVWFWWAITIPILHQIYVLLVWRLELYQRLFSKRWGIQKAFKIYTIGFSILFASRLISIILLAVSSQHSLTLDPELAYIIAGIITPLVLYLFYCLPLGELKPPASAGSF